MTSPDKLRVAAIQMCSGLDKEANIATAERLVAQAAAGGAELIALPELFNLYGDLPLAAREAETVPGPTSERLAAWAVKWNVYLCGGSIAEASADGQHAFNTSLLFSPSGTIIASYRKIHLFDVDLPGELTVRESASMHAGMDVVCTRLPQATLGQAICYDLRFPELFRILAARGMDVLMIPSAFTRTTGEAHWELLISARAVENQCFVLAPNQVGRHSPSSESLGGSLIVDPWGVVLARGGTVGEEVLLAELDFNRLREIRRRLPALAHRRLHP